ncbi:MAG: carbohydrate ABC transporter permease [Phycisphaerae bacterium]|jgi:ABC-type glycerol-3-phosphate transport system permease component|nr:carbohydrate ABC transporter permease [Phycisphaerae bacterium]
MRGARKQFTLTRPLTYVVLLSYLVIVVYPMFWLLYTSVKSDRAIFLEPFALPRLDDLHWENFIGAWTRAHFDLHFFNSVVITVATVALTLLLASMAAYALARFVFKGAKPLLFYFLAGLMIPGQLAIVPLFFQMKAFGLLDSRFGLLVVYVAGNMPFSIFVLAGFFKSLPSSLHEAALIAGAGEFRAFWSIMLPLARPAMITVGIFTFLGTWSEFFTAFILLSGKGSARVGTLPLALANLTIASQYRVSWGMAFAGLVLLMVPVLLVYVLLQRRITKGITIGAIKG